MFYGLSIIAGAWLLQWWFARRGQRSLQSWTLRFLALGFLVLVFETFDKAKIWRSAPALASFVLVVWLLWRYRR
ncbi:MAG TPA: hypothetical protein PLE07_02085 [Candidatus Paceibacterota bacterium]|nr:hypothetical protein [Candidatus Paceibacterota bacterium]